MPSHTIFIITWLSTISSLLLCYSVDTLMFRITFSRLYYYVTLFTISCLVSRCLFLEHLQSWWVDWYVILVHVSVWSEDQVVAAIFTTWLNHHWGQRDIGQDRCLGQGPQWRAWEACLCLWFQQSPRLPWRDCWYTHSSSLFVYFFFCHLWWWWWWDVLFVSWWGVIRYAILIN